MRINRQQGLWFCAAIVCGAAWTLAACPRFRPETTEATRYPALETAPRVTRVAVLPGLPVGTAEQCAVCARFPQEPGADQATAALLAALVRDQLERGFRGEVVDIAEVDAVMDALPDSASPYGDDALDQLREHTRAEGTIIPYLIQYRERIGAKWAASQPAAVTFHVYLVSTRADTRGQLLWRGTYDEEQRPVSENVGGLGVEMQRGIKWHTARELLVFGVEDVMRRFPEMQRVRRAD